MGKIPKPRKPGQIGGFGGFAANRRTHHAMRSKGGGCAVVALLMLGAVAVGAGYVGTALYALL